MGGSNSFSKFTSLFTAVQKIKLQDRIKSDSLETFMKLLQNKQEVRPVWALMIFLNSNFNTSEDIVINYAYKILLSSYTIYGYPDEILSSSRNEVEKHILTKSKELVDSFECLLVQCEEHNYEQMLTKWFITFNEYATLFTKWKEDDLQSQIEVYTKSYYELEVMLHNMDEDKTNKDIWEKQIKKLQDKLRFFVKSLAGKPGLEYLDNYKYSLVMVDNTELRKRVEANVHKAYWNKCKKELLQTPPNYSFLVNLLKEIVDTVKNRIIPNRKKLQQQFEEVIDVSYIEHQILHGVLDFDKILIYAKYIVKYIKKWGPAIHEKEIDVWFKELLSRLEPPKIETFDFSTFITDLFRGIMERLEGIAVETCRIRQLIKKQNAREI